MGRKSALLLWLLFWRFAGRDVGGRVIDLRHRNLLLIFYTEEHVVAKTVPAVNAPAFLVVIHLRALRQPHIHIALGEFHRTIFDRRVIGHQSDLWHRRDQIRL